MINLCDVTSNACRDNNSVDLLYKVYMDMTSIIFADLDIARCVYIHASLHKHVTTPLAHMVPE